MSAKPKELGTPERKAAPDAAERSETRLMLEVALLMTASPAHRLFFLADLEWLVRPALRNQQYRLFRRDGEVFAFVSWGLLSEEAEARFIATHRIAPLDWRSGARPWLIDLVAPHGGAQLVFDELNRKVFPGQAYRYLRSGAKGPEIEVARGDPPSP
jgi:cytolysin-activating lysine-acyltransferase